MLNEMMSSIWLLNALENALLEPNGLSEEILDNNVLEKLVTAELEEDEFKFANKEVEKFLDRINITIKLLQGIETNASQLLEKGY